MVLVAPRGVPVFCRAFLSVVAQITYIYDVEGIKIMVSVLHGVLYMVRLATLEAIGS